MLIRLWLHFIFVGAFQRLGRPITFFIGTIHILI